MKENYKLERELLFKNNIREITTISLDSDYKMANNSILGNFIISGEYKIHEVSINKEKFNFKIPFNHKLKDDIDEKTVSIEITNFVYDYKKDELIVEIDYDVIASRKDVLLFDDEKSLDEFLRDKEVEIIDDRISDIKKMIDKEEESDKTNEDSNEEKEIIEVRENKEEIKEKANEYKETEKIEIKSEDDREKINSSEILDNVGTMANNFITYKIHIVSSTDTIESIILKYNITIDELKEYNDVSNVKYNDKIIIPLRHE